MATQLLQVVVRETRAPVDAPGAARCGRAQSFEKGALARLSAKVARQLPLRRRFRTRLFALEGAPLRNGLVGKGLSPSGRDAPRPV